MTFLASAFTAGQTLTASLMESIRDSANAGHNIYTNEAARDAAITSPTEGMMVYLTAPTVPAATGAITAVPTGVQTVYNGFVWVCITPVGSRTDAAGALNAGAYTPTLTGTPGTNPSVTLVTGTTALVSISNGLVTTTAFGAMSFAVSGAGVVAASDAYATTINTAPFDASVSRQLVMTGLTAGTNTFTLQYRTGAACTYFRRNITVIGIA